MSNNLMRRKSAYTKRRLIISFIMCTILGVMIMAGFSSFDTDNRKFSAVGQRIVMHAEPPTTGTPEDYDLVSNVAYTAQRLYSSKYFRGETSGKVIANLGMGIPYTQEVYNTRVVKDNKVFTQSISSSSMKSVAEQKYIDGTKVLYRPSTSVSGKSAKFANRVKNITSSFGKMYGLIPNELTKQAIGVDPNTEYGVTIKSVRDENAVSKSAVKAANTDGGESGGEESDGEESAIYPDLKFDIPQNLVPDADGHYKFTLNLDAVNCTIFSRNETRTLAGADDNPSYKDGYVTVTITIDENWYPISVTTRERYDIAIPGIGPMTCESSLTERFYDIGNKNIVIPDEDFFISHMNDVSDGPDIPVEPDATTYLTMAFGKYISGASNLDLRADISVGGNPIVNGLGLSVNLGTMNIRAKLGKLGIEYTKDNGGRVYLSLNDIKGYLSVKDATSLISDPAIKKLAEVLSSLDGLPDIKGLDGISLGKLLSDMKLERKDGKAYIKLPIKLDKIATVDAVICVTDDKDKSLVSITGKVTALGTTIDLLIEPETDLTFEKPDDSYVDLSPALDFIPAAINTALGKTYGIAGSISVDGKTVNLDAYIDRTDGIAVDAIVSLLGTDVKVKYIKDAVYASVGNIGVKATGTDIKDIIASLADVDSGMLEKLKALLPDTAAKWINIVKSLEVSETELKLGLRFMGAPINITLTREGEYLTGVALDLDVNLLDLKFNAAIDLDITRPEHKAVVLDDITYAETSEIMEVLPDVLEYAAAEALTVTADGSVSIDGTAIELNGLKVGINTADISSVFATGAINALGQELNVTFIDNTAYIGLGNLKFKLDVTNVDALIASAKKVMGALNINMPSGIALGSLDTEKLIQTALGAIEGIDVKDGVITVKAAIGTNALNITLNTKSGEAKINGAVKGITFDLTLNVTACTAEELDAIRAETAKPSGYSDIAEIAPTLDALAEIISAKALTANIAVGFGEYGANATLALDLKGGINAIKAQLSVSDITVPNLPDLTLDLIVDGDTVYVKVGGNFELAVSASVSEAQSLVTKLSPVLPENITAQITQILGMVSDINGTIKSLMPDTTAIDVQTIRNILDVALGSITELTVDSGTASFCGMFDVKGKSVKLDAQFAADLSSLSATAVFDGQTVSVGLTCMASGAPVIAPEGDYVSIEKFEPIIDAVLPLIDSQGFMLGIDATLFGVKVSGDLTIALPTANAALAVKADLTVGDVPMIVTYVNDNIYVDINNGGIMIACGTTAAEISALVDSITSAVPELGGLTDKLSGSLGSLKSLDMGKLLNSAFALRDTQDGFTISADLAPNKDIQAEIGFVLAGAKPGINVSVTANTADTDKKNDFVIDVDAMTKPDEKGIPTLTAVVTADGTQYPVEIKLKSCAAQTVTVSESGYINVADLVKYIEPVKALAQEAMTATSMKLAINARVLTADNKQLTITGNAVIDLKPVAVYADITLLGEHLFVTYSDGVVYIKLGSMCVKFAVAKGPAGTDGTPGESDLDRLQTILAEYLPKYLSEELAVLLGTAEGTSSLSDIGLIMNNLMSLATTTDVNAAMDLLFGKLHNYDECSSTLKTLLDMIGLYEKSGAPTVSITLAKDMAIDVTPIIEADNSVAVTIGGAMGGSDGITLSATVNGFTFDNKTTSVTAPVDTEQYTYISVMDYINLVNSIVHTFTTTVPMTQTESETTVNGDITFRIDTLNFTYKADDKKVKNADGTETTIPGDEITVKNDGDQPILKGIFKKTKDGLDIKLEAHVLLSGVSAKTGDISLALYVLSDYTEEITDETTGETSSNTYKNIAYLCYKEGNGFGENISIDYDSVMQIIAAVFKILGLNDSIIPEKYKVGIESDLLQNIFKSMNVIGLDSVRAMVDDLINLVNDLKLSIKDISDAWSLVVAPDSAVDEKGEPLSRADKIDLLLASKDKIMAHLKSAIGRLIKEDASNTTPTVPDGKPKEITVKDFSNIVNGITLTKNGDNLGAKVKNELTTKGEGDATIYVTQSKVNNKGVLNGIEIQNLDVKTALINGSAKFSAGCTDITIAPAISKITSVTNEANNTAYSDFSNLRHLLFDVLNTANMMEFEIGETSSTNYGSISFSIALGTLDLKNCTIYYNIKVKLIEQPEGSEVPFKTAAYVELIFKDCKFGTTVVLPNCTTRLMFYDDNFYINGCEWYSTKEWYGTKWHTRGVDVHYTMDQLKTMPIDQILYKFLFYVFPLSRDCLWMDLQNEIVTAATGGSSSGTENTQNTIAQIFKGYTYNVTEIAETAETKAQKIGTHNLVLGLAELAGMDMLGDATLDIVGANDGDSYLLDNYISDLSASIKMTKVVNIQFDLTAKLKNASVVTGENGKPVLKSTGLTNTTINGGDYDFDTLFFDVVDAQGNVTKQSYINSSSWN